MRMLTQINSEKHDKVKNTTIQRKFVQLTLKKKSNFVLLCNLSVYELTSWMKNGKIALARIR